MPLTVTSVLPRCPATAGTRSALRPLDQPTLSAHLTRRSASPRRAAAALWRRAALPPRAGESGGTPAPAALRPLQGREVSRAGALCGRRASDQWWLTRRGQPGADWLLPGTRGRGERAPPGQPHLPGCAFQTPAARGGGWRGRGRLAARGLVVAAAEGVAAFCVVSVGRGERARVVRRVRARAGPAGRWAGGGAVSVATLHSAARWCASLRCGEAPEARGRLRGDPARPAPRGHGPVGLRAVGMGSYGERRGWAWGGRALQAAERARSGRVAAGPHPAGLEDRPPASPCVGVVSAGSECWCAAARARAGGAAVPVVSSAPEPPACPLPPCWPRCWARR